MILSFPGISTKKQKKTKKQNKTKKKTMILVEIVYVGREGDEGEQ
jgi:hypothetical protein